jgi:hypothetical protein
MVIPIDCSELFPGLLCFVARLKTVELFITKFKLFSISKKTTICYINSKIKPNLKGIRLGV